MPPGFASRLSDAARRGGRSDCSGESVWTSVPEENAAYLDLLKHFLPSLIAKWQTAGNMARPFPGCAGRSGCAGHGGGHGRGRFYEFYQPDDALSLADVMADSGFPIQQQSPNRRKLVTDRAIRICIRPDEGYAALVAPHFSLIRVDGLDAGCAAEILRMPKR